MQKISATTIRVSVFSICLCVMAFAQSRPITSADVSLVSVNRTGVAGNAGSFRPDISADGRHVVFRSNATDLVNLSDTNNAADIYVRDTVAGTTRLVSVNRDGTAAGNGESGPMVISANGRYVAFASDASDLTANDTNGFRGTDYFVRDLQTETTALVSVNTSGGNSFGFISLDAPSISADGRFIAFSSGRRDLVENVGSVDGNIFVRDMVKGVTVLASPDFSGTHGGSGGGASFPSISADGRYVAFQSGANDLVAGDTNGPNGQDIFIRDLVAGKTWLASRNTNRTASGNGDSYTPRLSADGRSVVFASRATNLYANDNNNFPDYFVYNLDTDTTTLVTVNSANSATGNAFDKSGTSVTDYAISGDGRRVVFWSPAIDLVANDNNNAPDIFLRDLSTSRTTLVSVNTAGTTGGNAPSSEPQISLDGRYVLFRSLASNLTSNHGNSSTSSDDLFVRDVQSGITNLVSVNLSGVASGLVQGFGFRMSGNGQFTAFTSGQGDLVSNDSNNQADVFLTKMLDAPSLPPSIQFSASAYTAAESTGRGELIVTRSGDVSDGVTVGYATVDDPAAVPCDPTAKRPDGTNYPQGTAYARCDYATTLGVLAFAPGERSKSIHIPLIDDAHAEVSEVFQLRLFDPTGTALGTQSNATLTITDDDPQGAPNPIYTTPFFVRVHYLDFLSREPEPNEPWSGVLNNCPNAFNLDPLSQSAGCDRLIVSQSFVGAPEFRLKGLYAFNFYRVAFGRRPEYAEIIPDMSSVSGATAAEVYAKRAALPVNFTKRAEFKARFDSLTDEAYVNALLDPYQLQQITTPDPANPEGGTKVVLTRGDLMLRMISPGTQMMTRAQVLRAVVESNEVGAVEYNGAFVAMQYYGYLRRTPEESGYQAWLRVINQDPNNVRIMVNGFMNSTEYRLRFGQP